MATVNQAVAAGSFTNSIGINAHADFVWTAYGDIGLVQNDLAYLGAHNVRDSIAGAGDLSPFVQLHNALGVQFDFYLNPDDWSNQLQRLAATMPAGSINYIEGANEPDVQGPSMAAAQSAQTGIYGAAHSTLGVPVIQTSFGNINDYGSTGDQSAYADFGNAHTYFGSGNNPGWANWIGTLNADAQKTTPGKPVFDTETGYYTTGNGGDPHTVDETVQAKYTLDILLDSYKAGNPLTYLYELLDTGTGNGNSEDNFGLFHTDGSPKLAATGVHNLIALLADPNSGGASPGSLAYDLSGMQDTDNSLLMQKSDGTYWLALWNDTRLSGPDSPAEVSVSPHTVTLNLGSAASNIQVFDPLSGTSAVQSFGNTATAAISVPDHPVLVEIGGAGGSGAAPPPPSDPAPVGSGDQTQTGSAGGGGSSGPVVTAPASQTVQSGQSAAISGVSISDPWAGANPGTLALNITDGVGTVAMQDGSGNAVPGSGTSGIHVSGTLAQLNAELATLSYSAGGADDTVTINVWDQSGAQASQSVAITDPPADGGGSPSGTGGANVTIDPSDASPVILASDTTIQASAGDHMIFLGGTGNTLTASGGTETVQAYQGGNTITTGAGDDTIRYAGSGNTIDAGAGNNTLEDSGSGNTIVLPTAGQGTDSIFGYVLQNGDQLDLRQTLAQAGWSGDASTLGNYLQVGLNGNDAVISVAAGGSSQAIATLHDSGALDVGTLLAHSIT